MNESDDGRKEEEEEEEQDGVVERKEKFNFVILHTANTQSE